MDDPAPRPIPVPHRDPERPEGWYRNPDDSRHHRHWDGTAWTTYVEIPQQRRPAPPHG